MIRILHQSSIFESLSRLGPDEWLRAANGGIDVQDVGGKIGHLLEFGLCGALEDCDACRGYWCDGVIFRSARRKVSGGIVLEPPSARGGAVSKSPYIIVDDADKHYARAVAAGAEIVTEIKEEGYGGREYSCRDPEGYVWNFSSYDPWASA